ncbi:interleukin-1 beta-like [Anguilla anguilla]|uniref:interleukin-1 beta-like n=1 Tax=Anguilla anguilla TaxID=7936 RepID=UPI0015A845F6|nr:interleukin-1 beta-like [Anguilla anguilla]XP_035236294.1 interleukin-1 beta-like [Anguilla anguilla]
MEFNTVCIDFKKTPGYDHEGLQLEVSQHAHGFRRFANIVVAVQRMKHRHAPRGTEFSDDELISILLENVIEERVTPVVLVDTIESRPSVFRSTEVVTHSVCDRDQKGFVLKQAPLELQAVVLQGGNMDLKVNLNLSTYVSRSFTDSQRRPVALGIAGCNLYLSCSEAGGDPILQLEEVTDADVLKTIDAQGEMARFLFLKRDEGFGATTLESLKFRDWFISTAVEDRRPVEMSKEEASARLTTFAVKPL